jgi:hypothetical protein
MKVVEIPHEGKVERSGDMEWNALPSVDWWLLSGGILWSIFCVTLVYFVAAALTQVAHRVKALVRETPGLAERR